MQVKQMIFLKIAHPVNSTTLALTLKLTMPRAAGRKDNPYEKWSRRRPTEAEKSWQQQKSLAAKARNQGAWKAKEREDAEKKRPCRSFFTPRRAAGVARQGAGSVNGAERLAGEK